MKYNYKFFFLTNFDNIIKDKRSGQIARSAVFVANITCHSERSRELPLCKRIRLWDFSTRFRSVEMTPPAWGGGIKGGWFLKTTRCFRKRQHDTILSFRKRQHDR